MAAPAAPLAAPASVPQAPPPVLGAGPGSDTGEALVATLVAAYPRETEIAKALLNTILAGMIVRHNAELRGLTSELERLASAARPASDPNPAGGPA